MKVVLKNGDTKNYKLTLKMLGMGRGATWHHVDYDYIIDSLEKFYPNLKGNIARAYL